MADLERCLRGLMRVRGPFILKFIYEYQNLYLRYIIVRMEIKRNPMTQVYSQKQNNLMQPLLNISKASTPVRTRVLNPHAQPNSTPINFNKIAGNVHKSPNNKENYHSNTFKTESTGKSFMKQSGCQNRINLSPILALNRKLNEGPKYNTKKSLTPEAHNKIIQDYGGYENENRGKPSGNPSTHGSLNDSKGMVNYNSASNLNNLRGSNCFKALIQTRNKSPNRFEGNKTMNKKESNSLMKESLSSTQLFKNGYESKGRLSQSRSFDQLRGIGNAGMELSEIKCMNNDGKRAKYRVLNDEDNRNDQNQLYYCSKCTIPLVQQGFIVEEIGKQIIRQSQRHPEAARLTQYQVEFDHIKKNTECVLMELSGKEEEQIEKLDHYYATIFDYLERQQRAQKKKITDHYKQRRADPEMYLRQINDYINNISEAIANPRAQSFRLGDLEDVLRNQQNFQNCLDAFCFNGDVQQLTDRFIRVFEDSLKVQIGQPKHLSMLQSKGNEVAQNRNHAMRFSFQKLITENNNKKSIRETMKTLLQVDQEDNEQDGPQIQKQELTAFRDLFPEGEGENLNTDIYSPTFKKI